MNTFTHPLTTRNIRIALRNKNSMVLCKAMTFKLIWLYLYGVQIRIQNHNWPNRHWKNIKQLLHTSYWDVSIYRAGTAITRDKASFHWSLLILTSWHSNMFGITLPLFGEPTCTRVTADFSSKRPVIEIFVLLFLIDAAPTLPHVKQHPLHNLNPWTICTQVPIC